MSNIKVSELTSGSVIYASDILYMSQDLGSGLISKQITLQEIQESFAYSIIRQDIGVYYGDTYSIGNSSGGTFNSLYLGSGGLHIGYWDSENANWMDTMITYDPNFSGLLINNNIATNHIHLGYVVGGSISDSGVTMNYTHMTSPQYTGNTVMFNDEDSIVDNAYTRTVDLFGQVVPMTGNDGDLLAKTSDYTYDWQSKQDLGLATTGSNTFHGAQGITGSLSLSGITSGSLVDSALVINPITHVVGTMPQGLRTTYGLFSQTGNSITISGTTTESTLIDGGVGTLTVPANGFNIGDAFRADLGGIINTNNNETIRIRIKTGNVILADSGVQTVSNVSNNVFTLSLNFIIRNLGGAGTASIVTIGRFSYNKTVNGNIEGFSFNTLNNTTFNTTIDNTLDITLEFGSNSSNNNVYTDIFTLNKIY